MQLLTLHTPYLNGSLPMIGCNPLFCLRERLLPCYCNSFHILFFPLACDYNDLLFFLRQRRRLSLSSLDISPPRPRQLPLLFLLSLSLFNKKSFPSTTHPQFTTMERTCKFFGRSGGLEDPAVARLGVVSRLHRDER